MAEMIHSWLYALLMSGCICSLILYANPDGRIKTLLETGCACVMTLTFLSPLTNISSIGSFDNLFDQWEQIEAEAEAFSGDNYSKTIIEGEYSAYILTEAERMNVDIIEAKVIAEKDENGYWLPVAVTYSATKPIPDTFKRHIANELGILEERQATYEIKSNHQQTEIQ